MFSRSLHLTGTWTAALVLLLAASGAVDAHSSKRGGKKCSPCCHPTFGYYPTQWRPWPQVCDLPHGAGGYVLPPGNGPGKPAEPPRELAPPPRPDASRNTPGARPSGPSVTSASYTPVAPPPAHGSMQATPYATGSVPPAVRTSPNPPQLLPPVTSDGWRGSTGGRLFGTPTWPR